MNELLKDKLKKLPLSPGVYFHKNTNGEIIYVGKAANLRNRVRQYFHKSRFKDPKTEVLISEITDVDWIELETEIDALFLEAEMIRRYMPRFNILLRDDKSFVYVRIDLNSNYPSVTFTRRPLDDGATYLGPYTSKLVISRALKYLRKVFPYSTHTSMPMRACLQAQLGICPGLEAGMTTRKQYIKNLRQLIQYLKGNRKTLVKEFEAKMKNASHAKNYELAAIFRNKLFALKELEKKIIFSDRENIDISKDYGLIELGQILGISPPRRIEGFDISHMQGVDNAASMVVFIGGVPAKKEYRRFKMRITGNDDFAHMNEVISRRFSMQNQKRWGMPDLVLIDGVKGQVHAALKAIDDIGVEVALIGLAKRYEEIIVPINHKGALKFDIVRLPKNSHALKLLQRIRDESHRFAVSYHSHLKEKRQHKSFLDDIDGVGPATKKKLIKHFGSSIAVSEASELELSQIVAPAIAKKIINH